MDKESKDDKHRTLVVTILLCHVLLVAYGAWYHSATTDEWGHLPSGIQYWKLGRTDAYRVNPPLVRAIATIPLTFSPPNINYDVAPASGIYRPEMILALNLIDQYGADAYPWFFVARLMCIPFSILGALVCYAWAKDLFGPASGICALCLWCFSPNVLGFAQLITSDVAASAFGCLFLYQFVRWWQAPSNSGTVLLGLILGLTVLTKFTWLSLAVILPTIVLIHAIISSTWRPRIEWITWAGRLLLVAGVAVLVVNCAYSFDGFLSPIESTSVFVSDKFRSLMSLPLAMQVTSILPTDFVMGIDRQFFDFETPSMSYLRGEWRDHGWYHYYVYAMLIKMPIGFWLLLLIAFVGAVRSFGSPSLPIIAMLVTPAAILFLVSRETGFNCHLRYVLPAFPFLFILGSFALASQNKVVSSGQSTKFLACLALTLFIAASLLNYPHSISFFNQFVGGSENGHRHLLNSNIDYGQDLKSAANWLEQNPEVHLDGVEVFLPPSLVADVSTKPPANSPVKGSYLLSISRIMHHNDSYRYFLELKPKKRFGYSVYFYEVTEEMVAAHEQ